MIYAVCGVVQLFNSIYFCSTFGNVLVTAKTYFPNLVLKAPLSTEQISLRDLLTHRSAISIDGINFRTSNTGQYTTEEIFNLLSNYTKPVSPAFEYKNIGYKMTGYAVEKATGESWQKNIERKLLEPLGMNATTFYVSKVKNGSDFALPYVAESGAFIELPHKQDNQMHAAGGTAPSAEDLANWLIVGMNGGKYNGKQIISSASLEEIHSPQINQKRRFINLSGTLAVSDGTLQLTTKTNSFTLLAAFTAFDLTFRLCRLIKSGRSFSLMKAKTVRC